VSDWWVFQGIKTPHAGIDDFLRNHPPPPWRQFKGIPVERTLTPETRGDTFQADDRVKELVNTALYLRRPLLVTGKPGSGKSSLAYAVAYELQLNEVLSWPINTRSTLQEGLYRYDAIGRLQEASLAEATSDKKTAPDIGRFLQLGPLGTALLPTTRPRILLIDEIDKSDIDLPNDLLNVFEEGRFEIPELARLPNTSEFQEVWLRPYDSDKPVPITRGRVACHAFPLVILTSNGEREFPPAFLRRCLRLTMPVPDAARLAEIVQAHFHNQPDVLDQAAPMIERFLALQQGQNRRELATDQLLNAVYLSLQGVDPLQRDRETLIDAILSSLSIGGS